MISSNRRVLSGDEFLSPVLVLTVHFSFSISSMPYKKLANEEVYLSLVDRKVMERGVDQSDEWLFLGKDMKLRASSEV